MSCRVLGDGRVPQLKTDTHSDDRRAVQKPDGPCRLRAAESWVGRAGHRAQIFWFWRPGRHAIVPGITVWVRHLVQPLTRVAVPLWWAGVLEPIICLPRPGPHSGRL